MEVRPELMFLENLKQCPKEFIELVFYMLDQIELAASLNGIEGIKPIGNSKEDFKMEVDKSRIGLMLLKDKKTVIVTCFIFNQFYKAE